MIANWKQKGRIMTLAAVLCLTLLVPFLFSSAGGEPLPTTAQAILARRYASFSYDEFLRINRVLSSLLKEASSPLQQPWEDAAGKVMEAIKGKVEALKGAQSDPLKWAEEDKAAVLDALAAAYDAAGYPLPTEGLTIQEKAQRFTDLVSETGDMPDNDEEESWQDQWSSTLSSPDFRSIKGKVDFKKEWTPKVDELLKSGESLPENGDLRHLLSLDFRLPAAEGIKEADALEKAKAAILDKKGWKAEDMDAFRLWSSACLAEKDGTLVYWFSFSWDEEKLIKADKLEALEKQRLARAFPMVLAVKINAKTGELHSFTESFDMETPYNRTI